MEDPIVFFLRVNDREDRVFKLLFSVECLHCGIRGDRVPAKCIAESGLLNLLRSFIWSNLFFLAKATVVELRRVTWFFIWWVFLSKTSVIEIGWRSELFLLHQLLRRERTLVLANPDRLLENPRGRSEFLRGSRLWLAWDGFGGEGRLERGRRRGSFELALLQLGGRLVGRLLGHWLLARQIHAGVNSKHLRAHLFRSFVCFGGDGGLNIESFGNLVVECCLCDVVNERLLDDWVDGVDYVVSLARSEVFEDGILALRVGTNGDVLHN